MIYIINKEPLYILYVQELYIKLLYKMGHYYLDI